MQNERQDEHHAQPLVHAVEVTLPQVEEEEDPGEVRILRILHGAQEWPETLPAS